MHWRSCLSGLVISAFGLSDLVGALAVLVSACDSGLVDALV